MVGILNHVTAVSCLVLAFDWLMYEVQEAVDALYMKLHAMSVSPDECHQTFYDMFDADTRQYKGVKLNGLLPSY
ncbi:hypothetical protein DPMN_036203 [Dreissena polymorpha]|uniref:Uncharacterized protein n=1 Tax=Dreissena polymorpha TaxID=45954 RepID=A0A9D4MC47_DREPO|nr:hypothetical protein DPMN_036203 [Dreissena polymorpha]